MLAGQFKVRITLWRDPIHRVNGAEVKGAPVAYATPWSTPPVYVSGGERWRGHQVHAEANVVFTLRYRTDILTSDRVVYRGKEFEIKAVKPDEEKRETVTLECRG